MLAEIEKELNETREHYHALVNSIPEAEYDEPTDNPAWTVGDILFHITLGPRAMALEIWMIAYLRGPYDFIMRHFPSRLFNSVNAGFTRQGKRFNRQRLIKAYGKADAVLRSVLKRLREEDLRKSVVYPPDFVSELKGEVSIERLFHYVGGHFEMHTRQLREASGHAPQ